MKTRDSGMPDSTLWDSFFDPRRTLRELGLKPEHRHAADFGCGYGTFAIPAAAIISGNVYGFDIDPAMAAATNIRARMRGLTNVIIEVRDFMANGTGLGANGVDFAMLFNILHAESPGIILAEAKRILAPGGTLALMHWNYDPATPRGPSMAIRPKPEQCRQWAAEAGFVLQSLPVIPLPPWHYGITFLRP